MIHTPKDFAIIHHADWDGMAAAWVAKKYLQHVEKTDDYVLISTDYGEPFPIDFPSTFKCIYILDFSYDKKTIQEVAKVTKVIVLDHHLSAKRELEDLPGCIIDIHKSGALLTWTHFFGTAPPPHLVSYVDDHDMWRFKLPYSKYITNAIYSFPLSIAACNHLDKLFGSSEGFSQLRLEGQAIDRYQKNVIKQALEKKHAIWLGDYYVPACNWPVLQSEIAHALVTDGNYPFACCYHYDGARRVWRYSLRTDKEDVDLSRIANEFGGGGHPKAAGFELSTAPFITDDLLKR